MYNQRSSDNKKFYFQNPFISLSTKTSFICFSPFPPYTLKQNLVYSPEKLRRVRIILFVVGGIVLLGLLATALYFIISASDGTDSSASVQPGNAIQLEDVLQGKLAAHHFNGSWSSDSNVIYKENNVSFQQV